MKKVSIVIPVYNMKNKISKCVNSIANQTYANTEIILIDDGSNDGSYEECESLSFEFSNIKVFHTDNRGSGPARNYGIEMATGDYIYFPDADDKLDEKAIEILVDTMNKDNCDLIVFGYSNVSNDQKLITRKVYPKKQFTGKYIRKNYDQFFLMSSKFGIQGAPWNKFFDLCKIKKYKIKYPELKRHQDEVFISRYVEYVEKVCFIENTFYTYYTNNLKAEWDKYPKNYLDIVILLKKFRCDTILTWNPDNQIIIDLIEREYICNVIKALELSFSKKYCLSRKYRKLWIKNAIEKSELQSKILPNRYSMKYQGAIMYFINKRKYLSVYGILSAKVFAEKNIFS